MASSGGELDMEDDPPTSHEGPGKKVGNKFLQPFRKMRRFFSSRRRGKGREGEEDTSRVSIKSKSTTDVLRAGQEEALEEESAQLVSNKTLSMSADSVFTPDTRPKETQLEGLKASARSMEQLAQPPFSSELFQKLKSRRSEDEEDDGLPRSPVTQPSTTRDVLDDFKKTKHHHDSKHSVDSSMSSEDELDERDVFGVKWTAVTASKSPNMSSESAEEINFDALSSTSSLSNKGARHKLEVGLSRKVRPSTQFRRAGKAQTATSLPQVEEKEEIKAEEKEEKDQTPPPSPATSTPSLEAQVETPKETPKIEVEETVDVEEEKPEKILEKVQPEEIPEKKSEIEVKAEVEPIPDRRTLSESSSETQEVLTPPAETEVDRSVEKAEDKVEDKNKERPVCIIIPKAEKKASPVVSPRSPKPQEKKVEVEAEKKEAEKKVAEPVKVEEKAPEKDVKTTDGVDESSPFKVVLRKTVWRANLDEGGTIRRRDNVVDKDPTKRQTIAGDSGLALFGDRKPGQRTSFVEVSRSPEPIKEAATGNNEFTQVLSRLKKQSSRKSLIADEKKAPTATAESKAPVAEAKAKASGVSSPKPAESSPKVVVVEAKPSVVESVPKKIDTKPTIAESRPKVDFSSKPKIAENKPRIAENKPKITDSKPKVVVIESKASAAKSEDIKKPEKQEVKPKESIIIPKESSVPHKSTEVKEKEVVIVSKKADAGKPREPEVKVSKSDGVSPLKPVSVSEPKAQASSVAEHKVVKPGLKTVIIEKAKPVESRLPAEKAESKPAKVEVKAEDKQPVKRDLSTTTTATTTTSSSTKNRGRSQTLTEQPVTGGANKENEKTSKGVQRCHSHGDTTEEKASSTSSSQSPPSAPATQESGKTSEPAWFTLARKKTANWGQKEKDLEEIKEKKDTSNQAEKERGDARDSSTKAIEVTLTIDDAAKEDSKPALRNVGKCSNSASSRQSKVLDMAKLFQNQVS